MWKIKSLVVGFTTVIGMSVFAFGAEAVPIRKEIDLSKLGVVYEGDIYLGLFPLSNPTIVMSAYYKIINRSYEQDGRYNDILMGRNQNFDPNIKITITPSKNLSNQMVCGNVGNWEKSKIITPKGKSLETIFGTESGCHYINVERYRSYHIRAENLKKIDTPKGLKAVLTFEPIGIK